MFKAPVPYKRKRSYWRERPPRLPLRAMAELAECDQTSFSTVITFEKHQLNFENINITNNATLKLVYERLRYGAAMTRR